MPFISFSNTSFSVTILHKKDKECKLFDANNLSYITILQNQSWRKIFFTLDEQFNQFHSILLSSKISREIRLHIRWIYFRHEPHSAICLFSIVASFENRQWRQLQHSSSEMDLDLHFTTSFSVVRKHLMCCPANICNKLPRDNLWPECCVFGSSLNNMQTGNAIANIPQSTEFVCCWTGMTFIFSTSSSVYINAHICCFLQKHLFGQKMSCRNS